MISSKLVALQDIHATKGFAQETLTLHKLSFRNYNNMTTIIWRKQNGNKNKNKNKKFTVAVQTPQPSSEAPNRHYGS
jgi:hypothetical protein